MAVGIVYFCNILQGLIPVPSTYANTANIRCIAYFYENKEEREVIKECEQIYINLLITVQPSTATPSNQTGTLPPTGTTITTTAGTISSSIITVIIIEHSEQKSTP